ncbi:hypothetical protein [Lawsonella clevelandensis]|uniref:Uncharacterized protein n=1 Tax=Lawsonella clevelandensis TaxID=1528099 RepID=A0A0M4MC71_9ACTN|nr:hypothetical protein [Lawsonella clevelandensis]ALE19033.1 hypothetical protein AL705_04685 [Lawsonella clevelandensis]ALE34694.1 hypothetical protein IY73_04560 [Lawsonella clevelandensis]MDU7193007.1 hypothetical protein [Lawsonella clevelandensis]
MNINAEFRALKQLSGLTSQHIADKFDVGLRTAQRYETEYTPRSEIMEYLRSIVEDDTQYVEEVLDGIEADIHEANEQLGEVRNPGAVRLLRYLNSHYYYQANGVEAIPYERYTARLGRIISALILDGYEIEYEYYTTEEG